MPFGDYDNTYAWLAGDGILTVVAPFNAITWNGNDGLDWETPTNWDPEGEPDAMSLCTIDNGDVVDLSEAGELAHGIELGETQATTLNVSGELTVAHAVNVHANGSLDVAGGLTATSLESAGTLTVQEGAAVGVGDLTITGGSANLAEDVLAENVEITGGTIDTGDKAIVVSGTLTTPDAVVTPEEGASFQAIGSGQPGEITVGMTENGKTTTVTPSAGPGGTLEAPDVSFQSSTGLAVLDFDADVAVVGDLVFVGDAGIDLSGAPDVSVRNLVGAGLLMDGVSVRGAVQPGAVPGSLMEVFGSVKLEPGAALQPEVQGAETLGTLYDAIGPSWVPGSDASSMFGGTYVVADTGGINEEFAVWGGGNIGAAYIANVAYDVDLGGGAVGLAVTLHAQLDGDVDLDGEVARGDVLALRGGFGSPDADWFDGDLTFDGDVNYLDYIAVKRSMGDSVPAGGGMIPEPATLALLALGALAGLRRRRRRRH
jgi:hypothetical protein